VQFEHQQTESSDVRFPAAQVMHEVFLQFIGWNFVAQVANAPVVEGIREPPT
jgi:hypothetical protein